LVLIEPYHTHVQLLVELEQTLVTFDDLAHHQVHQGLHEVFLLAFALNYGFLFRHVFLAFVLVESFQFSFSVDGWKSLISQDAVFVALVLQAYHFKNVQVAQVGQPVRVHCVYGLEVCDLPGNVCVPQDALVREEVLNFDAHASLVFSRLGLGVKHDVSCLEQKT